MTHSGGGAALTTGYCLRIPSGCFQCWGLAKWEVFPDASHISQEPGYVALGEGGLGRAAPRSGFETVAGGKRSATTGTLP